MKRILTAGSALLIALVTHLQAREPDEAAIRRHVERVKNVDKQDWKKIPWSPLIEARQQSRKENRPVFLFTHDGNIETGRC